MLFSVVSKHFHPCLFIIVFGNLSALHKDCSGINFYLLLFGPRRWYLWVAFELSSVKFETYASSRFIGSFFFSRMLIFVLEDGCLDAFVFEFPLIVLSDQLFFSFSRTVTCLLHFPRFYSFFLLKMSLIFLVWFRWWFFSIMLVFHYRLCIFFLRLKFLLPAFLKLMQIGKRKFLLEIFVLFFSDPIIRLLLIFLCFFYLLANEFLSRTFLLVIVNFIDKVVPEHQIAKFGRMDFFVGMIFDVFFEFWGWARSKAILFESRMSVGTELLLSFSMISILKARKGIRGLRSLHLYVFLGGALPDESHFFFEFFSHK